MPVAFDFSHQGHALVTLYVQFLYSDWSKFDRWVHAENLCSILKLVYFDSWSWHSFVSTCDVFNCLSPLNVQNEIQLLSRVFCYSWLVCLLGFWLRNTSLVKVGNLISEWHRFPFLPCLTRKRVEKSEAILALLDTSFQRISSGSHVWLVALRGELSDVARWGMIAFCRRKGALQNVNMLTVSKSGRCYIPRRPLSSDLRHIIDKIIDGGGNPLTMIFPGRFVNLVGVEHACV